jgi:hypothetical protein
VTTDLDINCQFYENGRTIDLISIAVVAPDGEFFYGINQNMPFGPISNHAWLMEHVMPSLPVRLGFANPWDADHPDFQYLRPLSTIAESVRRFITRYEDPCLWSDYSAYNHVALAQLWGPMVDLPEGIPMWTADVQQEIRRLGASGVPELEFEDRHALTSAWHNQKVRKFLRAWEKGIRG